MSLFKRKGAKGEDATPPGTTPPDESGDLPEVDREAADDTAEATPVREPGVGPFDVTEVDGSQERLDVGALWLPLVDGIELQLQMDEGSGQVTGVFVVLGDSAVQLQAFAAPRHEGIWREVCGEIAAGITEQGGTADPGVGPFGHELLARVPSTQPDGKVGFQPLRFTGVDGPRWLLRAVFHGQAAIDAAAAEALEALVAQVVVVRGSEPMGPRELLPLHLPAGAEESGEGQVEGSGEVEDGPGAADDLNPFERGPEITERR
ncbi:MAG: DUF3710 domain-containing protein [Rhodoferax sp.]|nr:DUF3710 domain-containing protein [Actinomycetota bacterium]